MNTSDLKGKIPNEILEAIIARGILTLTPPQSLAIEHGLLSGSNMVVASPTASGKTLIAEIAAINSIIRTAKKAIYIAPLRALASEKYNEFKSAYPYIKSSISIGDLDANDQWLSSYDLIFTSTEKFDSIIRHGADWIGDIGCVIFDEVHMLGELSRGPTLELLITKIKETTNAQILALSATIGNAREIANWLKAKLVESNYRPVRLRRGIIYKNNIYYHNENDKNVMRNLNKIEDIGEIERLNSKSIQPEVGVLEDTLSRSKQLLIFYSTRRNAEAGALRLSKITEKLISEDERRQLSELSDSILNVLDTPTEQCKKLSISIKSGIAFHHAGMLNQQRAMVEEAFHKNIIKALCATTTLSMGINIPANTVLIKDIHRYDGSGSSLLGINEVTQLFGRAGRPKFDIEGRAFIIASSEEMLLRLENEYMNSALEPIDSSIGVAPVLRTHILSFIAENFLNSEESINKFISKTFYGHQYKDLRAINEIIHNIIEEQIGWEFIENKSGHLKATKLGSRISQLYIDPLSAKWIIDALMQKRDIIGNLFMITNTIEMRPYVKATDDSTDLYMLYINKMRRNVFENGMQMDYGIYDPERAFSTALMLNDWLDEQHESKIVAKYATTPGALYTKLNNAEWILHSAIEIARQLHITVHDLSNLNVRLRYGIKEELLDLVRLEQIGRVRARMLFDNGITNVNILRNNKDKVAIILGKEITARIFRQFE